MSDDHNSVEVENSVLGKLKVSSANLNTLFTVLGFGLTCVLTWVLWTHTADAKDTGKEVARELKESNKEVAQALRESNREVAKVLEELARSLREANCLAQFHSTEDKAKNSDLCKRISR